ncbi:MAG: hypothetical protein K8R88_11430, partial [Armatimonadetes bacterium]|nr:hypothetical protein [Armatimonadota bacterium]
MPLENGAPGARRGKPITVRSAARTPFSNPAAQGLGDDLTAEPGEDDLLELAEAEEEIEEPEGEVVHHGESEELEMWMRQTRRAHLLTPAQEESLAKRVQARDLAESNKMAELAKLLNRKNDFNEDEIKMIIKSGIQAKQHLI